MVFSKYQCGFGGYLSSYWFAWRVANSVASVVPTAIGVFPVEARGGVGLLDVRAKVIHRLLWRFISECSYPLSSHSFLSSLFCDVWSCSLNPTLPEPQIRLATAIWTYTLVHITPAQFHSQKPFFGFLPFRVILPFYQY